MVWYFTLPTLFCEPIDAEDTNELLRLVMAEGLLSELWISLALLLFSPMTGLCLKYRLYRHVGSFFTACAGESCLWPMCDHCFIARELATGS